MVSAVAAMQRRYRELSIPVVIIYLELSAKAWQAQTTASSIIRHDPSLPAPAAKLCTVAGILNIVQCHQPLPPRASGSYIVTAKRTDESNTFGYHPLCRRLGASGVSTAVAREQCDFSGISHSYFLHRSGCSTNKQVVTGNVVARSAAVRQV
jgi:hypothetical protein